MGLILRAYGALGPVYASFSASASNSPLRVSSTLILSPLKREYIIDKINLRRVQKDCLISYAGNQYSAPAEYVDKDVAVVALDNMLAAYYYEGKQIALHQISYQKEVLYE